jgi:DNA-binding NtrC family response regulator
MPLEMQAKMLRVLQEKVTTRLGGSRETAISCRIVATTNRDLAAEARRGMFRQDLYFRLRVIHIELPPLRDRKEDIVPLARHFTARFAVAARVKALALEPDAEAALLAYAWPGNLRELRHEMQRALVLAGGRRVVLPEDLSPALRGPGAALEVAEAATLEQKIEALERSEISRAWEEAR